MLGDREVIVFYDERMLGHCPDVSAPFLPGRLDRRVREVLSGLPVKWAYPEHPGRLLAIRELLERQPVPGVRFETASSASREQLARVHTLSYLNAIAGLRGKNAWLDMDTTAVSASSVEAAEVAAGSAIAAVEAVVRKGPPAPLRWCVRPVTMPNRSVPVVSVCSTMWRWRRPMPSPCWGARGC